MISIRDANLNGKVVFLRVDFNVPIKDGKILDNYRITRALSTIQYLLERKTKIIIATHLGKPAGEIIPDLSTIPLASELAKLLKHKVYATDHVIHPTVTKKIEEMNFGDVLMLGNLRWHKEEEQNNERFAEELASYADIYVNDAFGASHRAHASIDAITNFLPSYGGFLLESEKTTLDLLVRSPQKPYIIVLGGAKVKDKSGLINNLAMMADKILIGGAIANTFLAARGTDISESLYEREMFETCEGIMAKFKDKILLPEDQIKEESANGKFKIMDIGPNTIELFKREIAAGKTVFWNGNMGYSEDQKYENGTRKIAEAISQNNGTTVVAGGDTVGFINQNNLSGNINFISTGGGATLNYLAGEKMPGLFALEKKSIVSNVEEPKL